MNKATQVGLTFGGIGIGLIVLSLVFTLFSGGDTPINYWCATAAFITGIGGVLLCFGGLVAYADLS